MLINTDFIYPVGSIYISVNAKNPSKYFGGTWQSFGSGRTLVGVDTSQTEFDTVQKTGGSKYLQQHSHNINGWNQYNNGTGGQYSGSQKLGVTTDGADGNRVISSAIANTGSGNAGNLQPYVTVYMWRRTA